MALTELNKDTHNQISDLLENLQQTQELKNKDMRILLNLFKSFNSQKIWL